MASLIPIGTCLPGANAEGALRAAMDYGFETGSVNFHMKTMDKAGLAALAERLNRIRDGRDFQITTLGFYLNPIENAEHFACLKTVIDCAHLFGATHVSTFAGALSGRPVEESIPKFGEVFRELAARAEDAGIKLGIECCPMGGGWHSATCNIGFTPRAWELMFDEVRSENFGLEWEPTHVMVQLIDPIANLKNWIHKVVHVHGKDANIDWEGIRKYGVFRGASAYARDRIPGMGDTDWRKIFTILRDGGYTGDICIEGYHDRQFGGELEMTGQIHALNYLKWCRGGDFTANPWTKA